MAGEEGVGGSARKAGKAFDCPSCGSGVEIRAQGLTVTVACRSCGSLIDATNENHRIVSKAMRKFDSELLIPLGRRGTLQGTLWETIGFMKRSDGTGEYVWEEYLLFNPMRGFRWLVQYEGHWNFVTPIKERPKHGGGLAQARGRTFKKFLSGSAVVREVVGEFYWRVKAGEKAKIMDFVAPPEILTCEETPYEINWSIGEYLLAETVRSAFAISRPMPAQLGVAPSQPSRMGAIAPAVKRVWGLFVSVLVAIQFLSLVSAPKEEVFREDFVFRPSDPAREITTRSFQFGHGMSNVEIRLLTRVDNAWLEIEGDLVNDQTHETHEFETGVEYYSGVDSDDHWTEGNQDSSETISSVPEGTYHLNLKASGSGKNVLRLSWETAPLAPDAKDEPYTVVVVRGVTTWGNFWWSLLVVSAFPAFVWWRCRRFELDRWSTSDLGDSSI